MKRRVSQARREAAQARDAEFIAQAEAALADPAIGDRIVALLASPRLLGYSLRNQAWLLRQAEERGMRLTELHTYRGWQARGRQVREGEKNLKMVRRYTSGGASSEGGGGGEGGGIYFRAKSYFDISQTEPIEGFEGNVEPDPDADPAMTLLDSLKKQAERAGYSVTCWPPEEPHTEPVSVDHEHQELHVYGDHTVETLARLAAAVAAILTAGSQTRTGTAAREAEEDPDEIVITVL
ncbi:ArdC-like ssDNA-binding domain-containing protein [Actinoallomurus sp. NPDC052274]|uniref:ArdC-like ssDNA-binding domain-containing protein n=1 Tax=Actinoallomurus sp. NPDC052274 TaxID=3155420 RepID=UPI003438E80E